jgi:hypothetical protein
MGVSNKVDKLLLKFFPQKTGFSTGILRGSACETKQISFQPERGVYLIFPQTIKGFYLSFQKYFIL